MSCSTSGAQWAISAPSSPPARRAVLRSGRVDVDEPAELGDLDLIEADLGGVESDQVARAASTGEVAVEVVGPGVVRAHQIAGGARTRDEFVGPVLADVVEGLEFALVGPHDDDRHPGDLCGDIAARSRTFSTWPIHCQVRAKIACCSWANHGRGVGVGTQRHRGCRILVVAAPDRCEVRGTRQRHVS